MKFIRIEIEVSDLPGQAIDRIRTLTEKSAYDAANVFERAPVVTSAVVELEDEPEEEVSYAQTA
jgi:hypothetical protein